MKKHHILPFSAAIAASFLVASPSYALKGPANVEIDGGPLGMLDFSAAADGGFYAISGTTDKEHANSIAGDKAVSSQLSSFEMTLQKSQGPIGFTLQIAGYNLVTLGTGKPKEASITHYTTGPLRLAYLTFKPNENFNISVGQFGTFQGYESGFDWHNTTAYNTLLYALTNSASRGVSATYNLGSAHMTALFGDGNDTGVFNYLQLLFTENFNKENSLNIFSGNELGVTGPNAFGYGGSTVGKNGIATVDSNIYGAWYTWKPGNWTLIPEFVYRYANPLHKYQNSGYVIPKETDAYGAAVFGQYNFGTSPYSIGGWAEYGNSHGSGTTWFIAPNAEAVGFSVAPAWQQGYLFARANLGYFHLLNGSKAGDGVTGAYGNDSHGRDMVVGLVEAGILY